MLSTAISSLLLAAVIAVPVLAQAEEQQLMQWQHMSTSWSLEEAGGPPIPCVKTAGGWPDGPYALDKRSTLEQTRAAHAATFRCGAVVLTRNYRPGIFDFHLAADASWSLKDKASKTWPIYVPRSQELQSCNSLGSTLRRCSVPLNIGGAKAALVMTQQGRLIPAPQPVFR